MSESTATKSNVFKEDLSLAVGGSGAEETGTRKTSTGGSVSLTQLDASHIKFQTVAKSLEDLVDGGKDVTIKPLNIDAGGTLTVAGVNTLSNLTPAGYVKNSVTGVLSTVTPIPVTDIGNGVVSNTEFELLNGATAIPIAATQAQQETGTATTVFVSPGVQQYHPSAAKAWVKVTGAGTPAIAASYNVTSVTDVGPGSFTVNFTVAFSSINYSIAGVASWKAASWIGVVCIDNAVPPAAAACRLGIFNTLNDAVADLDYWTAAFFGDQ